MSKMSLGLAVANLSIDARPCLLAATAWGEQDVHKTHLRWEGEILDLSCMALGTHHSPPIPEQYQAQTQWFVSVWRYVAALMEGGRVD